MSIKELKKLGFKEYGFQKYTHPIFFPKYVVEIKEKSTIEDILQLLYNEGFNRGNETGYAKCQEDIRFILQVKKEDE